MEENEELHGGVVSPSLVRGRFRGYALYTTNKRVIGLKKPKAGISYLIGVGLAGPVGGLITERATRDENDRMLQELDVKKDFDMKWDNINRIELKKPSILVGGHVIFHPRSGEPVKVKIGTRKDFDIIAGLMRKFLPEAINFS
jgi:hypothetical protein